MRGLLRLSFADVSDEEVSPLGNGFLVDGITGLLSSLSTQVLLRSLRLALSSRHYRLRVGSWSRLKLWIVLYLLREGFLLPSSQAFRETLGVRSSLSCA
jgi:hypothetical protein